ncbi:hypothetical protein PIROE2DRAFT_14949 [Piromyces sp. E2]|nr:hypothetical protein PIROE2DRAFT_14949 [Piromyces sp. E2]|eukprot:OUM59498.1 hypothetical protein PIROE2DRAFT_14949 [Piromyces sp. E2]
MIGLAINNDLSDEDYEEGVFISDDYYEKEIRICTQEEVNEVLNSMKKEEEALKIKNNDKINNTNSSTKLSLNLITIIILNNENEIQFRDLNDNENEIQFRDLNDNENEIQFRDLNDNENEIQFRDLNDNENLLNDEFLSLDNLYSNDRNLPTYIESYKIINNDSNSKTEYLIQSNDKKNNTMNIVDAEVVDSVPSNYNNIIQQFKNNFNNNNRRQSLPSYVEVNKDRDNNNNNDIKNKNSDNEIILSSSESQLINLNTPNFIDIPIDYYYG